MSIKRISQLPSGGSSITSDDIFVFVDNPSANGGIAKKITLNELASAIGINNNAVISDTTGIVGASEVTNIVQISQANYDAITVKNSNTIYFIV